MGVNDTWVVASLDPQGLDWQDLCRRPINIAIDLALSLMVSEKKIFEGSIAI